MFSDVPEYDGHFSKQAHGSFAVDGHRVTLIDDLTGESTERCVVGVSDAIYMVGEDDYRQYGEDGDVIKDIGVERRLSTVSDPDVCLVDADSLD